MSVYKDLDISNEIYLKYKEYILKNCDFNPNIRNKTPQNFSRFPTIIIKETINSNDSRALNRQEFVDRIAYTVDIYTKDMTLNGQKFASIEIMDKLKYLTFDFFNEIGMNRDGCDDAEHTDITIDRKIIIFSCRICNWNRKII